MTTGYIIIGEYHYVGSEGTWLYWNNQDGWGDEASATIFTQAEQKAFTNRMPQGSWGWVTINTTESSKS